MEAEQLIERVATLYQHAFTNSTEARLFLGKKGITNTELYTRHQIGCSNGTLKDTLPSRGNLMKNLRELGVLREDGTEYFQNCLTFPVSDVDGRIINVLGLSMESGKTLFLPNRQPSAWNIAIVRNCREEVGSDLEIGVDGADGF